MKKVIGSFLILTAISVIIHRVDSKTIQRAVAPGKKSSQLVAQEMVLIPAGEFQMGDQRERYKDTLVHTVYLDAFYIDKYEVTNAHYKEFVDANPEWSKTNIDKRLSLWRLSQAVGGEYLSQRKR